MRSLLFQAHCNSPGIGGGGGGVKSAALISVNLWLDQIFRSTVTSRSLQRIGSQLAEHRDRSRNRIKHGSAKNTSTAMKTAILSIFAMLVASPLFATDQALEIRLVVPDSTKGAMEKSFGNEKLWVENTEAFVSRDISDAFATYSNESWTVMLTFTEDAAKRFAEYSKKHVNSRLAILSRGKVLAVPVLREPISGGGVAISGNFTEDAARQLVFRLVFCYMRPEPSPLPMEGPRRRNPRQNRERPESSGGQWFMNTYFTNSTLATAIQQDNSSKTKK
jgi:hypothetical protein